jgi:small subunit ribosomal protein S17
MEKQRGRRVPRVGVVVGNKMSKTLKVEIDRIVQDPAYEKRIRRSTRCYVHDERNEARVGDRVEIMPTRPLSKLKRWRLVRVVSRAAEA